MKMSDSMRNYRIALSEMSSGIFLFSIFMLSITVPLNIASADNNEDVTYTLSGHIYTADGQFANTTSIKVDSMASVWSQNGYYEYSGITSGEHTVRAYFMNDGHTVAYRTMFFSGDIELDWYVDHNWITAEVFDENGESAQSSPMTTVKLVQTGETHSLDDGRTEFGPYKTGEYYSMRAYYGDIDHSTQYVHFKLEKGSNSGDKYPHLNDFDFNHGMNSRYGFITNVVGAPIEGITVSNGAKATLTNSDGFYLLQSLEVGSQQTLTFHQSGNQVSEPIEEIITIGDGWLNKSVEIEVNLPGNVSFSTPMQTMPLSPLELRWEGSEFTDYFSVYAGEIYEENLIYRGYSESLTFEPEESGMIDFNVVANNSNGSTENINSLRIIFLPSQSNEDKWNVGMTWDYRVSYAPSGTIRNVTMTMIGSELIEDAFGVERDSFLLRLSGDYQLPEERSFRWVDSENLLNVHTYWVDDPTSSSYFQEGTLGWDFTDNNSDSVNPLVASSDLNLHFNRTNVIGVPGHPDGYADTYNTVTIEDDVQIATPAGNFSTKYIKITDNNDQVISWELWYNETVRNWVKIVDRLSGSHSDKVEYELLSYDAPTTPQFITQEAEINTNDYLIEWGNYAGSSNYQLVENGEIIFEGEEVSFEVLNREDGEYTYVLRAVMDGYMIDGASLVLSVNFIPPKPIVYSPERTIEEGNSIKINWTQIEDSDWYSVIVEDDAGNTLEVYKGQENETTLEDLDLGQNRIRVNSMVYSKISEFSDSIFITVEESEDRGSSGYLWLSTVFLVGLIIFGLRTRKYIE